MKLKTVILCLALLSLPLFARAGTADLNTFQSTMGLSFDIYPTNTALILVTNSLPAGLPPNNGTFFTNGNYQAFLETCLVFTNASSGYITNDTTHAAYPYGSINQVGTNYETILIRLGPNEVYGMLTNNGANIGITYSETRN